MSFDEMDYAFVEKVQRVARAQIKRRAPLVQAWHEVVEAASPALGSQLAKAALALPVTDGLVTCSAVYASLLLRDNGRLAADVRGLWFGLAECGFDEVADVMVWTPYISGSARFSATDKDWPCDPAWLPEDRWAVNEPMSRLSALREKHQKRAWYIEVCLIEPLHALYVTTFARACPSALMLGGAESRGIGCGFDDGDLLNVGEVDKSGLILKLKLVSQD